jgi:hypothetical protein
MDEGRKPTLRQYEAIVVTGAAHAFRAAGDLAGGAVKALVSLVALGDVPHFALGDKAAFGERLEVLEHRALRLPGLFRIPNRRNGVPVFAWSLATGDTIGQIENKDIGGETRRTKHLVGKDGARVPVELPFDRCDALGGDLPCIVLRPPHSFVLSVSGIEQPGVEEQAGNRVRIVSVRTGALCEVVPRLRR